MAWSRERFGECAWYESTDGFTGERGWVASCLGMVDRDLQQFAQTCIDEGDVEHCPFCGEYLCETTEAEHRADMGERAREADEVRRMRL